MRTRFILPASLILMLTTVAGALATDPLAPVPLGAPISALYNYSLKLVGLAVFVMFLIAGFSYLLPESMKPGWMGRPWDIIKDAVIGLVLLFAAVLILNTINPDLTGGATPTRSPIFPPAQSGAPTPTRSPIFPPAQSGAPTPTRSPIFPPAP